MRVLDAIARRLQDSGVGTEGTTIFAGGDVFIPQDGTSAIITLTETGGRPPDRVHNSMPILHPSVQIVARADQYPNAAAMIDAAYNALGGQNKIVNTTLSGIFFLDIHPTSEPLQLPVDAQGRVRLAFNIDMTRRS